MKITKCLVACDLNDVYLDFYPLVRKYWKNVVGIDTILILIADEIPYKMNEFRDEIILFKPVDDIHTSFQAQCIRILYPCLFRSNENIIISDMDLIPLNQKYYVENVKDFDDDNFIVYRDVISEHKQYPICFCLANSKIWKDIFNIKNETDISDKLKLWYNMYDKYEISSAYSMSWACDQLQLFEYVNRWNVKSNKLIKLKDEETNFKRLDRMEIDSIYNNLQKYKLMIQNETFSDFHLPRPLNQYSAVLKYLNIVPNKRCM
jgi:hypothetical protein